MIFLRGKNVFLSRINHEQKRGKVAKAESALRAIKRIRGSRKKWEGGNAIVGKL